MTPSYQGGLVPPNLAPCGRRQPRVLVVDDYADYLTSLGRLLEVWGYETRLLADGPTALSLATAFHPDVALIDLGLPRMDGHELTRRLKQTPGCAATTFVAVTGWTQPPLRAASAALDMMHLLKPVDPDLLKAILDAATSGRDPAA